MTTFKPDARGWRGVVRASLWPTFGAVAVLALVADPTYRFPLLALLLPLYVRGAAAGLRLGASGSKVRWMFEAIGFAGFLAGWLLAFATVAFGIAAVVLALPPTTALLKQALLAGVAGLLIGAWFFWPWYVGDALRAWPRHDVRIATASGNRWDRLFLSWRMQRMAAAGNARWRGFGATGLVMGVVALASAMGSYAGWPARVVEGACVLALPVLHSYVVTSAHAVCVLWSERSAVG